MKARGILSFGPASEEQRIILRPTKDLPILVEIVDTDDKIDKFLPIVESMVGSGMVTTEKLRVHHYGRGTAAGGATEPTYPPPARRGGCGLGKTSPLGRSSCACGSQTTDMPVPIRNTTSGA